MKDYAMLKWCSSSLNIKLDQYDHKYFVVSDFALRQIVLILASTLRGRLG